MFWNLDNIPFSMFVWSNYNSRLRTICIPFLFNPTHQTCTNSVYYV